MSQENVDIVRRWFAAIAEGELAPDLWDADLIVDNIPEFPVTGPYRGYEGLQRWWDDLAEVVEGARVQLDEATRLDDERVLTIQRLIGDMAYTRIPVDAPWRRSLSFAAESSAGYPGMPRANKPSKPWGYRSSR